MSIFWLGTRTKENLYGIIAASGYDTDFAAVFSSLVGQPKTRPISHVASLHGIISTVAAHMRQDAAHSVVLPAKRLLLMLHHSKNQQS